MDTGKVEYAPDYKSESQVRRLNAPHGNTLTRTDDLIKDASERQRLEREVIRLAKEWRELRLGQAGTRRTLAELMDALDNLVYFESRQSNG